MIASRSLLARPSTLVLVALLIMTAVRLIHLHDLDANSILFEHPTVDALEHYHEAKQRADGEFVYRVPTHAPLYPTILGVLYGFADHGDPLWLRFLASLSGQITVLLLFLGGRRVIGSWPAAIAALFLAIYRPGLLYECEFYAAGFANLLVTAVAMCLAACLQTNALKRTDALLPLALGLGLGFASITRTNLLLLTPVSLVLFWLGRRAWKQTVLVAVCAAIPVLMITYRNHAANGEWVLIQGRTGHNIYQANHPGSDGTVDIRPGPTFEAFRRRPRVEANAWGVTAESNFYLGRFFDFVREEPGTFIGLVCRKAWNSLSPIEIPAAYDNESNAEYSRMLRLPLPGFGWLLPLVLAGLILPTFDRRRHLALAAMLGTVWLSLALGYAAGRYRYQAAGLLCVFAANGLHGLWKACRARERTGMTLGLTALIAGIAITALTPRFAARRVKWKAEYRQLQAYAYLTRGHDLPRARRYAELASRIDPTYAWPYFTLGVLSMYGRDGQPFAAGSRLDAAIEYYTKALGRWPDFPDALQNRGLAHFKKREYRDAVEDFRATIKLVPYRHQAYTYLGRTYRQLGLPEQARSCNRRAKKLRNEADARHRRRAPR